MMRIFKLKHTQVMRDLRKNKIFSKTQAKGPPHAHILQWLKRKSKIASAVEINDIISVEIPCKLKQLEADKLVVEHMQAFSQSLLCTNYNTPGRLPDIGGEKRIIGNKGQGKT
ncbi:hypothetical protein V2J09_017814 [Rumex salicifolius]